MYSNASPSEHVSVEYAYAMIEKREGSAVIILRVDNPGKAVMALRKERSGCLPEKKSHSYEESRQN